eukprot:TRINITY_DN24545_c0_g1_i1.p1 TRINITY_DN24545_c0_g1~~TRINITY_DN24545_c0_g1_i1.p1  ORF type:complete len:448 (+),score=32.22 TRINITY_DN24545_c0_g1_i1:53-1396(+)
MEKWWIGALAAAVGSLGAGLGENLVRLSYSHHKHMFAELDGEAPTPPWRRPLWVVGWLLTTVLTSSCAIIGLAFAPLQLVMPIGGLHILFGVAVAHVLNGESMSPGDAAGAGLVCLGVMVVLLGVEKENPKVTFDNIGAVLTRPESIGFFTVVVGCMLGLILCKRKIGKENGRVADLIKPVSAPALSGLLSAVGNLMLKLSLSLMSDPNWGDSSKIPFVVTLTLTILAGVGQVITLNHSLETSPAVVVVPTANSVLITVGSTAGLLFSSKPASLKTSIMLSAGILLVVTGIILLALREAAEDHHQVSITEPDTLPLQNTSFGSCDSNRSFGGYCGNISFNRMDTTLEMNLKKTFGKLGDRLASSVSRPVSAQNSALPSPNVDESLSSVEVFNASGHGQLESSSPPPAQYRTTSAASTASSLPQEPKLSSRVRSRFDLSVPAHPPSLS